MATLSERYSTYKQNARKRGLVFDLVKRDFHVITDSRCYYCGVRPDPPNGVDRVENGEGYILGNVVPCCWTCNRMKSDLTLQEFLDHCARVASRAEEATE